MLHDAVLGRRARERWAICCAMQCATMQRFALQEPAGEHLLVSSATRHVAGCSWVRASCERGARMPPSAEKLVRSCWAGTRVAAGRTPRCTRVLSQAAKSMQGSHVAQEGPTTSTSRAKLSRPATPIVTAGRTIQSRCAEAMNTLHILCGSVRYFSCVLARTGTECGESLATANKAASGALLATQRIRARRAGRPRPTYSVRKALYSM